MLRVATFYLIFLMVGCGGGNGNGNDAVGDPPIDGIVCDKFGGFVTGEVASYSFREDNGLEYQLSITVLEITSEHAKFYIEEQEVTTSLTSRTHTFERERGCSVGYDLFLNDRELLVLGYPSQWGAAGDGSGNQRVESCAQATQTTPAGEFQVQRCTKYFTLLGADTEEFKDDVVEAGGTPGSGFVARHLLRDIATGTPAAQLIAWSR